MDVPFIASGASSRAHYALVRKVEEAASEGIINDVLEAEVKSVQTQLSQLGISPKRVKESLIVLMYCSMTATTPIFPARTFDFALPYALSLVETGTTIEDKRIGYLFCSEMMCSDHEMRLMLVNTLRKDLEDDNVSRVCLALDSMITVSFAEIVPAVQPRLYDLLSHNHPSVRRKALLATRSLSKHEPELLAQSHPKILKRLTDPDLPVIGAALQVAETAFQDASLSSSIQDATNGIFEDCVASYISTSRRGTILTCLKVLQTIGLRTLSLPSLFDLLKACITSRDAVILLGLYQLLKQFDAATLHAIEIRYETPLIGSIREYIPRTSPSEQYIFLRCLEAVDTALWAGSTEGIPTVLEEWEVEKIMQLLDSNDEIIRRKTLHILCCVDQNIISNYYTQAVSVTTNTSLPTVDVNEKARRLLEVVEILAGDDGEAYGRQVHDLLTRVESHVERREILDAAVENVLGYIRHRETHFQIACAATLLITLCDRDATFSPTMMVILAALVTEYCKLVSIAPSQMLLGFCQRLKGNLQASVQEPCILSMLRIVAECESVPSEVTQVISELDHNATRHIHRRCDQFLSLSNRKKALLEIVNNAKSSSLPDFLASLHNYTLSTKKTMNHAVSGTKSPQSSTSLDTTPSISGSKLRYEAYEAPRPIPSLRNRRASSSQGSILGARSEVDSVSSLSPRFFAMESQPRTMSPGDLTLAASSGGLELLTREKARAKLFTGTEIEELNSRVDLIALDSPFVAEPLERGNEANIQQDADFEGAWNSLGDEQSSRGWCDVPMDSVVGRLQGLDGHRSRIVPVDVAPFIGYLKVVIVPEEGRSNELMALLRLKEEEDGCLWRSRCADEPLRARIKNVLDSL